MPKWKRDHDIPWEIEYAALEAVLSLGEPDEGGGENDESENDELENDQLKKGGTENDELVADAA